MVVALWDVAVANVFLIVVVVVVVVVVVIVVIVQCFTFVCGEHSKTDTYELERNFSKTKMIVDRTRP